MDTRDVLPDFRNLGVIARILLVTNAAGFAAAALRSQRLSELADQFAPVALALEPALIATLVALFSIQRQGTARVGAVFAPAMALWFVALAAMAFIVLTTMSRFFRRCGADEALVRTAIEAGRTRFELREGDPELTLAEQDANGIQSDLVIGLHSYFYRRLYRLPMPQSWRTLSWVRAEHRFRRGHRASLRFRLRPQRRRDPERIEPERGLAGADARQARQPVVADALVAHAIAGREGHTPASASTASIFY